MANEIIEQLKTCRKCGTPKPKSAFYRKSANKPELRANCIPCTKRLQPPDPVKARARYVAQRADKGIKPRPERVKCVCEMCDKEFTIPPAWARKGSGIYCSRPCSDAHKRARRRTPNAPKKARAEKRCGNCGVVKPTAMFRRVRDTITSECIECLRSTSKNYHRARHPFKVEPDLPGEKWKDIAGLEGLYAVSNLGRVRRVAEGRRTYQGRIVKPIERLGYLRVFLYPGIKGKQRKYTVNRLVADAFIPKPSLDLEVNHINGDKVDNRVENLEWVTHQQNMDHARNVLGVMGRH